MAENQKTSSNPTKVITGKGRLSYAYVWSPHESENDEGGKGEAKYSTSFLVPKTDVETIKKLKAAINAAADVGAKKYWGGKVPQNLKLPVRDGDKEYEEKGEAYRGCYFFNASSKLAPGIVDTRNAPITEQEEVYSGCYARISINFYPYNKDKGRGIACGLNNIQKLGDGEPFGSVRSSAADDFDTLEDAGSGDLSFGEDPALGDLPFGEDDSSGDLPFGENDDFMAA